MDSADAVRDDDTPPEDSTPAVDDCPTGAASVLEVLERLFGRKPAVSLRDVDPPGETPMPQPLERGGDQHGDTGKYQVMGVLGEGGVGVVHRSHDRDLGRDVAMKFLHEKFHDNPAMIYRFVEEAQIGGQLQHPGIVPVYELGMSQGRPFFTMKMVKGKTLAKLLAERESPAAERRQFLTIFEGVCQTLAYAHARGVVHRDIKPANVMIGSFGEVRVVDWGLGKVLPRGGVADERRAEREESALSVIETVRSKTDRAASLVGSVMGTPAYMPPEQARGNVTAMDERSDVFALGAILCEILTGEPPYVGKPEELIRMAAMAKLAGARARLSACGAEEELVELATRCLKPVPAARPRSAAEVATAVHEHLAAAEARVHEARVAAAEAAVRAASLGRAQRLGMVLMAVIGLGLAASLWFWRSAETQRGLADTRRQEAEARQAEFDQLASLVKLREAIAAEASLYPAWPDRVPAMRAWLADDVAPLRTMQPQLAATVRALEPRALPRSAEEREADRRGHPRFGDLVAAEGRLATLRRVRAMPSTAALDQDEAAQAMRTEVRELARRANASLGEKYHSDRKRLEAYAQATAEKALQARLEQDVAALTAVVGQRRSWRFENKAQGFLHRTLSDALARIERFEDAQVASAEQRLAWAERIGELTRAHPRASETWAAAAAAIAAADGVTASTLYAERPILDLQPQLGLVPIGMNPKTKLWEFYHLRSAWDPKSGTNPEKLAIPGKADYDEDGRLPVSEASGIIFVLLPGTTYRMGSQSEDPARPNYDAQHEDDEKLHPETVEAFFLARHELTRAQWQRLSGDVDPSVNQQGQSYDGVRKIGPTHPVEGVSWTMCDELLRHHGLSLPAEAAWEYGCRGGEATAWWTGASAALLFGAANVLDRKAMALYPTWGNQPGEFNDGWVGAAPVGSYRANGFGLFDVHGNVWEWCADPSFEDSSFEDSSRRAFRGGSFYDAPRNVRSASRNCNRPSFQHDTLGMRPARVRR